MGVDTLALLLVGTNVKLIAYCLMDNHLHLLLAGTLDDCLKYYDKVIHRIAQIIFLRHGVKGMLKSEDLDIVAVTSVSQLKKEICYIHRNPYKARISSPDSYPWSSADVYFKTYIPSGTETSSLGSTEKRRLFNTRFPIPENYQCIDRLILNGSFVSYKTGMSKFTDSVEYFDLLRRFSLEAEVENDHGIHEQVTFSDQELMERIKSVCTNEFHVSGIPALDRKDLLRLARLLALRYGAGQAQISRLLGIGKDILDRIL